MKLSTSGVNTFENCNFYDLDNFKVYVVSDMKWEKVYEVTPESFK